MSLTMSTWTLQVLNTPQPGPNRMGELPSSIRKAELNVHRLIILLDYSDPFYLVLAWLKLHNLTWWTSTFPI